MNKSRAMLFSAVLLTVAFGATAMAGTSVSFMAAGHTSEQSAVFASYLVSIPNEDPMYAFDTAISVSNVLAAPAGIDASGGYGEGYNEMGTLEIYLYNRDGTMMMHETSMDSPGSGLTDGMLGKGQTYTVLLSEIVGDMEFVGYGWVVANFDGVAGTRTVIGSFVNQHGTMSPPVSRHGAGIKPMMMSSDMDSGSHE
ncbi:MAG: hypothetical protein OXT71_10460 [Acidobacteriota bacterium]|nr:hypothetical protein [Acidobacteriota bacterium]